MAVKHKKGRSRSLLIFIFATGLLVGGTFLALEISGHPLGALIRTYDLKSDIREISRRSDAQMRSSTDLVARQVGGAALAQTIRQSRSQALLEKTYPVPQAIRDELEPHFPTVDFEKLKWKPANGRLSLGTALTQWYLQEGAIALADLIIFTAASTAENRPLWAHELTHVVQYQELGIDGFARTYVLDHAKLELQAQQNAFAVMTEVNTRASGPSSVIR